MRGIRLGVTLLVVLQGRGRWWWDRSNEKLGVEIGRLAWFPERRRRVLAIVSRGITYWTHVGSSRGRTGWLDRNSIDRQALRVVDLVRGIAFSIALLVGTSLNPLPSLLALGINALLGDAVLDTAKAGPGVVALFACLLAVSAGVLDLTTLQAERLSRNQALGIRIHVQRHGRVSQRMYYRRRKRISGRGRIEEIVRVGVI